MKSNSLTPEFQKKIFFLMLECRALEERLIKMYKQNDGFFWIGGPGEEAFNIPLGLLIRKGQGPQFDYFHGHYRSLGVLIAMGADPLDAIRQMKNTATDPYSGGRNFCGHISIRDWNIAPITSPIEVQYAIAIGTALANKRASDSAISVVVGGDAGTAEGDFATSLIWSSRPGNELPLLLIVTNNQYGISTPACTQHGECNIADRGKAFGIETNVINGNDAEESYFKLQEAIDYVRTKRKPFLLEAKVSRLYGHSSASGANFNKEENDPLLDYKKKLLQKKIVTEKEIQEVAEQAQQKMLQFAQQVRSEPQPDPNSVWNHVYFNQEGREKAWRP